MTKLTPMEQREREICVNIYLKIWIVVDCVNLSICKGKMKLSCRSKDVNDQCEFQVVSYVTKVSLIITYLATLRGLKRKALNRRFGTLARSHYKIITCLSCYQVNREL